MLGLSFIGQAILIDIHNLWLCRKSSLFINLIPTLGFPPLHYMLGANLGFTFVRRGLCDATIMQMSPSMTDQPQACFTLIVRPFGRAFLSWVTERRGRETDRRQFHTESHLT